MRRKTQLLHHFETIKLINAGKKFLAGKGIASCNKAEPNATHKCLSSLPRKEVSMGEGKRFCQGHWPSPAYITHYVFKSVPETLLRRTSYNENNNGPQCLPSAGRKKPSLHVFIAAPHMNWLAEHALLSYAQCIRVHIKVWSKLTFNAYWKEKQTLGWSRPGPSLGGHRSRGKVQVFGTRLIAPAVPKEEKQSRAAGHL